MEETLFTVGADFFFGKYTGRYPGKDMPVVSNDAPGKGGRWKFPE